MIPLFEAIRGALYKIKNRQNFKKNKRLMACLESNRSDVFLLEEFKQKYFSVGKGKIFLFEGKNFSLNAPE